MLYFKDNEGNLRQMTFGTNTQDVKAVQEQRSVKAEINNILAPKNRVSSPVLAVVK